MWFFLHVQARHVLEATLVGLQAVRQELGADSELYMAAAAATGTVLDATMAHLQTVFDSDIVF